MKQVTDLPEDDIGTVEAGLALIPTTLFFLLLLQVVIAGSWQVLERARIHDLAIRTSISGEIPKSKNTNDLQITNSDYGTFNLLVLRESKRIPIIGGLFDTFRLDSARIEVSAVSVQ
jgi:hypothetical protein